MTRQPIHLENANWHVEVDPHYGTVTHLLAKTTGWDVLQHERGLSFRLLVPLPDRRHNLVHGETQPLTQVQRRENDLTLTWNTVTSQHGGVHAITIVQTMTLAGPRLLFQIQVVNASAYTIENVTSPYLVDVRPPQGATSMSAFVPTYATALQSHIWPTFQNGRGYWGVDTPTQLAAGPNVPFVLLRSEQQGLCIGLAAPLTELVAWQMELHPGYDTALHATSLPSCGPGDGHVPTSVDIGGHAVTTRFAAVHVPYILPGETRLLSPIALQAYQGDWHQGADVYRSWSHHWVTRPHTPSWVTQPHAWQQVQLNSPEDELRLPFRNLVQLGEECARQDVTALQLVGWNAGGQDRGNPSHDPDPRLGTVDDFKAAIAAIQALGVKVILFAKFTWADRTTPWFRDTLHRYAVKDPYGDVYQHPGYPYQTTTQLLDINTRRLVPMCFLSEDYLHLCQQEFAKLLDLGTDGILFDECFHHGPALLCFDPAHGHRLGALLYANDVELIRRFAQQAAERQQEFLFAGEACYDAEFAVYHLSYHRSEDVHHLPLTRYLRPQVPLMTAVTGFNDRNLINQCLLYRYIISYEPYFFKGRLSDMPLTVAYGQQMDALRTDLRAYFWDGEFQDTQGAQVTLSTGQFHHPYTVFTSQATGQHALAIANYADSPIEVQARLADGKPLTRYRSVDDLMWRPSTAGLPIPARSAIVVLP